MKNTIINKLLRKHEEPVEKLVPPVPITAENIQKILPAVGLAARAAAPMIGRAVGAGAKAAKPQLAQAGKTALDTGAKTFGTEMGTSAAKKVKDTMSKQSFDTLFTKQNPALASDMAKRGLIFDRISHRWVKKPENRAQPTKTPKGETINVPFPKVPNTEEGRRIKDYVEMNYPREPEDEPFEGIKTDEEGQESIYIKTPRQQLAATTPKEAKPQTDKKVSNDIEKHLDFGNLAEEIGAKPLRQTSVTRSSTQTSPGMPSPAGQAHGRWEQGVVFKLDRNRGRKLGLPPTKDGINYIEVYRNGVGENYDKYIVMLSTERHIPQKSHSFKLKTDAMNVSGKDLAETIKFHLGYDERGLKQKAKSKKGRR